MDSADTNRKEYPMINIILRKLSKPIAMMIAYAMLASSMGYVYAQDPATPPAPTTPPKSEEVQRLEEEKTKAELREAIAKANKAELDAKFPKPTSTPLSGTTSINDGAVIEGQMMAYVSMAKAANKIVRGISLTGLPIQNLAIYNERDMNLLLSYKVAISQVDALRQQFCAQLPCVTRPTPARSISAAPLTIAQSFLGGLVDLTAFFRTNVEVKGQSFDIDEGPLVAEVFRAARKDDKLKNASFFYPFVFGPDTDPQKPSVILGKLEAIRNLRIDAADFISDVASKDQEISKAKAKVDQLKGQIELLSAKQQDAITVAQRILDTYCPIIAKASSHQPPVASIPKPGDPLDEEADKILYKIRQVAHGKCRRMPAEKHEQLFEIRDILKQTRADRREAITNLGTANKKVEDLGKERDGLSQRLSDPTRNIDDAVAFLKAASEQFDKFVTSIVQADATVGVNPLTSYIRAEKLQTALDAQASDKGSADAKVGPGYWLQLRVLKAGGNNRIKTNLIIDVFTGGNRISHSGGTIVQYALYNSAGRLVASDTITEYINYIKADKVKKLPCSIIDDLGPDAKPEDCLDNVRKF